MFSKIANRKKAVGSRRRRFLGGEQPATSSVDKLRAEKAAADADPTIVMKESDKLRLAALEALEQLKQDGNTNPFAVNMKMVTDAEGKESVDKLEEPFYHRCEKSTKLVEAMKANLGEERKSNLAKLLEAEKQLQEQKKSAVKAQAALNYLTKKNADLELINKQLDDLKVEISTLVDKANKLNTDCTTELDETINKDVRANIKAELEKMTEADEAITTRLTTLLDSIANPDAEPSSAPAAEGAPAPAVSSPASSDSEATSGGRMRTSRNRNLRKRRSFRLNGGGWCEEDHKTQKGCDKERNCVWNSRKKKCENLY